MSTSAISAGCPLCGDASEAAKGWMARFDSLAPGAAVCDPCAERVANAFWMAHGNKWLTWPNEPAPKPKKAVIPSLLRTAVFERDMYRCICCGTHLDLTADHVIPESKGGETSIQNLRTLCRSCNSRKGARMESEGSGDE